MILTIDHCYSRSGTSERYSCTNSTNVPTASPVELVTTEAPVTAPTWPPIASSNKRVLISKFETSDCPDGTGKTRMVEEGCLVENGVPVFYSCDDVKICRFEVVFVH